ncbi:PREDICTED: uncharacterized protein LOC101292910 [Fragaria vesca subsp. vesca]|uniref:uncharacterized protein LOC101292910 n=1 Tax=Fragaria vesca subsp. vesca TaxID=101020 RepID=UPI0002C31968|nr:PREDICTED: uncharacterized protein LOC101292910 [Fragaria vesca subsp. vesca]
MKIFYWNLRGIANDPTQNAFKEFVRSHSLEILCIAEPFVALESIPASFWRNLGMQFIGANDRGSQQPNLWVFCKISLVPWVRVLYSSDQQVSLQVMFDSTNCFVTAVYARTTVVGRRKLWEDITDVKGRFVNGPWLVFGDFNAVLGMHEKKGGGPVCMSSCEEFQVMSDVCELVHVVTKGAEFTWVRRRGLRGNVELRLDCSLASLEWLDAWDHLFRFRKMWLEHEQFKDFVYNCWSATNSLSCPLSSIQHKLRVLRKALRIWNWVVFGDVHRRVKEDLKALEDIQNEIASSGGSEADFAKETELQANLNDSLRLVRRCRSSVTVLRDGDQVMDDPQVIQTYIGYYYLDLFAKHVDYVDSGLVDNIIPSMVTEEENIFLTTIPSPEEILKAVKAMDLDSALGPDGFNGHFFASCWDIVGVDVVNAVQYFFVNGQLSASFNSGLIILIPKVEHADSTKQFRPIALTDFVFKIIPKILALRLSSVSARIISPQQHAFVPGRNISNCILTTSECFNLLDSKGFGGNVAVKVDITKAFDTLSWDFLLHVLQAFGFNHTFVRWVCALLKSAKLSILFNGRQLHRISSPRGTIAPSHVLFADDVIVFCRGDKRNLQRIMSFLEDYGSVSGQVPLATNASMEDTLIWMPSSTGDLTAKHAYQFLRHPSPSMPWAAIWSYFLSLFDLGVTPHTIVDLFHKGLSMGRSSQLKELWLICFTSILWFVWHARNKTRFDRKSFSVASICHLILGHIRAASRLANGPMNNSVQDLRIIKSFGAECRLGRAPIEVVWHPPVIGWVKINSDGVWKHAEGVGGFSAVFRDFKGHVIGAFSSNIDIPSSVAAEVMTVIVAIELAWVRD